MLKQALSVSDPESDPGVFLGLEKAQKWNFSKLDETNSIATDSLHWFCPYIYFLKRMLYVKVIALWPQSQTTKKSNSQIDKKSMLTSTRHHHADVSIVTCRSTTMGWLDSDRPIACWHMASEDKKWWGATWPRHGLPSGTHWLARWLCAKFLQLAGIEP